MGTSDQKTTIMIVEDEFLYAGMLKLAFTKEGYAVEGPFAEPRRALEVLADPARPIQLATLDVTLQGGATCHEVAVELHRQGIPFLFLTGGGITDPDTQSFEDSVPVLKKPVRINRILETVRQLIGPNEDD